MNVISKLIFALCLFSFSSSAFSVEIDRCLSAARKKTYILEQQQDIESCFQTYANNISQKRCFDLTKQISLSKKNYDLSETLNALCFYQTTDFPSIRACLESTKKFKIADNHDEAVFECYRQFQNDLSQKQCIEVSRQLIYPAKMKYLFQHCQDNP